MQRMKVQVSVCVCAGICCIHGCADLSLDARVDVSPPGPVRLL